MAWCVCVMVLLHVETQDARPVFACEVDKVPKKAEAGEVNINTNINTNTNTNINMICVR